MIRENKMMTVKYCDTAQYNGWAVSFEYETNNEELSKGEVIVKATKGNVVATLNSSRYNDVMIFPVGQKDYDLAAAVDAEVEAIRQSFAPQEPVDPIPQEPVEG